MTFETHLSRIKHNGEISNIKDMHQVAYETSKKILDDTMVTDMTVIGEWWGVLCQYTTDS